ncbi:uncharacterized protein BX664DRAFT_257220 [Halteromyces radiatus]|uniref:uncharacterized protein n=1 Tax=Halteromyces radiatus TaxID=101107 RepID=UPI00221F8D00|nr:uncharacterized protein BX664DRAFT_257220 [Halteromyces radiatus]KAI8096890.1 hypothetical protein BX664DRAFT_257220 [Halteromyces radiatus]
MSHTAFSLCYAPVKSKQYNNNDSINDTTLSLIQTTCNNINGSCQISISTTCLPDSTFPNAIKVPLVDTPTDYNITITGTHESVMNARKDLLQNCPLKIQLELKIPLNDVPLIFTDPTCHTNLFEKIRIETQAQITLTLPNQQQVSYFETENVMILSIIGLPHQVELARVRLLVALDELMNLRTDTLLIPRKLHYLICGRKRATLQPIVDETLINIYFPSPFPTFDATKVSNNNDDEHDDEPPIYITGDAANVSRVKDMLTKLANQKAKSMYHKDTTLDARKLDWMQLHRRDELCQIMHDNGSFIALPPLGTKSNTVTVYAENRVNAERTLRSINFLACYIYEACFYFHDRDGLYSDTNFFNSINNLATLTTTLSQVSGAEVAYRTDPGCIQVFGTERAVRNVYQRLHEMTFLKIFHQDTVFNVELSNDQREFISGKKNGKINKIMKTSGAKIKFLPFGEYNFILEVESTNFIKALDGLTLLQEELPAEISFYVPETYHKRIIGVGGKNIQRIMKKYGVYVKFSNAEEFASLGGYYGNEDNVVARTPMKNQINLDNLRHAVMDLITPKDKDFVIQTLSIPFRRHRTLLCDYRTYLQEVSKKTSVKIIWPNHELANDIVTLVGPQSNLESATQMMRHMVSDVYCFRVPLSNLLITVLSSSSFQEKVIQRLQHEMDITVDVESVLATASKLKINNNNNNNNNNNINNSNNNGDSTTFGSGGQHTSSSSPSIAATPMSPTSTGGGNETECFAHNSCTIPLKISKANLDCLPVALDILVCHLRKNHVPLYKESVNELADTNTRPSSNSSVTDNYSHHFESKLLSSVIPSGKKKKKKKLNRDKN